MLTLFSKNPTHYFYYIDKLLETTEDELKDLFAQYGTVELVTMPRDKGTGRTRGFAFVDMGSEEELQQAIDGLHETMQGGRTIRVQPSLPKEKVKEQARKNGEFVLACLVVIFYLFCLDPFLFRSGIAKYGNMLTGFSYSFHAIQSSWNIPRRGDEKALCR